MSLSNTSDNISKLDSDLLRTFIAIAETGSFSRGAERIFRSQSAASLQIKRLEEVLGQAVFERHARGIVLTASGEKLRPVATRIIDLLDQTVSELRGGKLTGSISIGLPDEYGETILTDIIALFCRQHPQVEINVRCEFSTGFANAIAQKQLDLAVYAVEKPPANSIVLKEEKVFWVGSKSHKVHEQNPLPVALFDRQCWWRECALQALEKSGKPYRVVYSSESVTGVVAAISAGIAVGLIGENSLGKDHMILKPVDGMPKALSSMLVLDSGKNQKNPAIRAMADTITQAFSQIKSG